MTDQPPAEALATRIEAADESQTWEMLKEAFEHIHGPYRPAGWETDDGRCETNLPMKMHGLWLANAPIDAAMMLLGDDFDAYDFKAIIEKLIVDDVGCDPTSALKRLPLAIAAAAVRAAG